jgi:hypothetical protein
MRKLFMLRLAIAAIASLVGIDLVGIDCQAQTYSGGQHTRSLIAQPIDESKRISLAGNTPRASTRENDRGAAPDSLPMEHMQLLLERPPELEQELQKLIDELHRKGSPVYHHWLTAKQLGERFGVSPLDMDRVTDWLGAHGFRVDGVMTNGLVIEFSGTAGQVREAFHTQIHNLEVKGKPHIANMSDPEIPAAMAGVVKGIHALHNFMPHSMRAAHPEFTLPLSTGPPLYIVAPADLATIYNLNPAFSAGITGAGQTVAVIGDSGLRNPGDWTTFRNNFGLSTYSSGSFNQVNPSGSLSCGNPGVNSNEFEAALDAEWASAAAPGAAIELASCQDTTTVFGGLIAFENLINGANLPSIASISFGQCEAANGAAANQTYVVTYQQAAAEGISVFVAAGDTGAAECDTGVAETGVSAGFAVNGYASTPYNVAVGGTDFGDTAFGSQPSGYWGTNNTVFGSALSYIPEIALNDTCAGELFFTLMGFTQSYGDTGFCNSTNGKNFLSDNLSGGGGPSSVSLKPAWQSVLGNPSDNVRDLPDVSLFAGDGIWNHSYVVCMSDITEAGSRCIVDDKYADVQNSLGGGTSFSAPIMAGIQALVNQAEGERQGNPNPRYYQLAAMEYGASGNATCNSTLGGGAGSSCVFYDVTQGDTTEPCTGSINCFGYSMTGSTITYGALSTSATSFQPAYGTTTGWDFATGLGSVNVYNLIQNWNAVITTTAVTVDINPSLPGQSVHFTATVTPAFGEGETGTVTWSANTGCAASPISEGVAVCATSALPSGTDTVTATYSGDSNFAACSGSVTEHAGALPAKFAVSAPSSSIAGVSLNVTVTALDALSNIVTGYAGTVHFTSSDPSAVLPQDSTLTNGQGSFAVTLRTAGLESIAATDRTNPSLTGSSAVTVTPGLASHLAISVPPSAYLGGAFQFTVTALDSFNNIATGYGGTVVFTSTDPKAMLPAGSTLPGGAGTFSATLETVGAQTITASDSADSLAITSNTISITIPNLVVTSASDDAGSASNCTPQAASLKGTDASCSLRDALFAASSTGSGSVTFDATAFAATNTTAQNTITLGPAGTLNVPSNTTIAGPASTSVTVNGNNATTVFTVSSGVTGASLSGLTIAAGNGNAGSGGGIANGGALRVSNSTISGGTAATGGGIANAGNLTLSGVTISGNTAASSGGGIDNSGVLTITNSTISANTASQGGGIFIDGGGLLNLANSIVSGNSASTNPDVSGGINDNGGNLVGVAGLNLASLAANGGPTQTMLPMPTSQAICAAIPANAATLNTDQRGYPRSVVYGGNTCVDAGAVQTNYALAFTIQPPSSAIIGQPLSPAPVVQLTESGSVAAGASSSISITDSAGVLGGTTSTNLSSGSATFSNLLINSMATSDTLTAALALNASLNLTAPAKVPVTATQRIPSITWAAPAAISYGTPLSATQLDATSIVPGTFVYTPSSGAVLSAGTQTLSVSFTPTDTADYAAATATVQLKVNQATPKLTWANPAAISYGTPLSSAQLDAAASVPGSFAYLPAAGTVLAAGTQTLSVTFTPADTTDYTTAATTVQLQVNKATPAITWATPAAIPFGTPLSSSQLDATAAVPGTFVYSPAGGTVLSIGSHTLSVTFTPADTADYTTATATVKLTVNKPAPILTWATPAPVSYGTALSSAQLDATTTIAGSFAYSPAAGTVLSVGAHTLSVKFTPTDTTDYSTATADVTLVVNLATPTLTLVASNNSPTLGTAITLTATPIGGGGSAPTGSVTFYSGATSLGKATLTSGVATLATSAFTVGPQSISAVYAGNTEYTGATSNTVVVTVGPASPVLTLTGSTGSGPLGTKFTFTAELSSTVKSTTATGTVTFFVDGISLSLVAVASNKATYSISTLAAGSHNITATYSGDANYLGASSNAVTSAVAKGTPAVKLTSSSGTIKSGLTVTFEATLSNTVAAIGPGGSIQFYDGTTLLGAGTLSNGSAAFSTSALIVGAHTITAVYSGDTNYQTATSSSLKETVTKN